MFSPSDYNDAVPQFSNGNYANEPLNPLYVEEPDAVNYKKGAEPLQTLPVQWWNWLWNKITAKLNNLNIYVKNIFNELAGLLSLVNVTPDATEEKVTTEQLKDMFKTKYPQYLYGSDVFKTEYPQYLYGSDVFKTEYPQYLYDNFKFESLLQGRTRGVMVAPTDAWNDNTNTLSLTGGFGIINTYHKVTFSDCNLVIPTDNRVHFIVSDTSGVISIQNSIANNVILIGLCSNKEYCLLIDNNPDQCKDNIILKKWFGQQNITQNFVPALQSYYNTAIASIETNISIKTISNTYSIPEGIYNNCTITIETVSVGGTAVNSGTLNNCTINIGTITNGNGITGGTLNNCTITIETVSVGGTAVNSGTLNNCTINIGTITNGNGITGGTLNNCTITIETVNGGTGIQEATLNNSTVTIVTVDFNDGISDCIFYNCTINIKTARGRNGINNSTLDNCTITINTISDNCYGVNNSTLINCAIIIETVNFGTCINMGNLNNCTITIKNINIGSGVYKGNLNNCTITINTVSGNSNSKGVAYCILDNCTITIITVDSGTGIFKGTYNNCIITISKISNGGDGIYSGTTCNNCTITIETVDGGTGISNESSVVLYFTYIKCSAITSLSNTAGKLNVLNDTVFHAS